MGKTATASSSPPMDYLPVQNSLDAFWIRDKHALSDHRSTPELPEQTDILIIGAGYAGVATAYHLLKDLEASPPGTSIPSITLLEARGVCSGATGRNGGHLRPDMYGHIPTYIDRAGVRAGAEIAEFEVANMYAIKKVIEKEGIDCEFTLARSVDVWCNEEAAKKAKKTYDLMSSYDLDYMKDVFFLYGDGAEGYCGVKGAKACASFTAGTMWPFKFILGLLQPMVESGRINLQTHTPAISVKDLPSSTTGHRVSVTTPRGSISAKQVIHTSNAYIASLLPEYSSNIIPCKGICCHITTPGPAPTLTNTYINRAADNTLSYLIPRTDGSIVVGGASGLFFPHRAQWYRNVDDSTLIDAASGYYDGYMQRTFRGWEESGAAVAKLWTGVMGYSFDSNPHVGRVPGREGHHVAAGFNGHGMPVIWLVAKGLAGMVLAEGREKALPFGETGMPRLFETTRERIERAQRARKEDGDILSGGSGVANNASGDQARGTPNRVIVGSNGDVQGSAGLGPV